MADSFTPNRNLTQPLVGGDDGTWGNILNLGVMGQLDLILGATQAISITGSDVTLTTSQWNNCAIRLSGILTGNRSLILPFVTGSTTLAVGGLFVVDNTTTGAFNVTVKTEVTGSTGVVVPQGLRTYLFSDGTNVWYADDSSLKLLTYGGNPNTHVAGTQGSVNTPPSVCWDYTNLILYVCTTTGDAAGAVWTNPAASSATLPNPQGYLTGVSNTPIATGDVTTTTIYYTPFMGALTPIHNGTTFIPYTFSQLTLALTTSQAANSIYDVFLAYNGGTPVIGTGPAWSSATAGSGNRGTGAGTTQLSRSSTGFLVNAVSMSLIWNTGGGNTTIVVPIGQALYLGSIWIDSTSGRTTCNRTYGQSRKWGIWNCYNRQPIYLQAGDSTATWDYGSATIRASNNNSNNNASVFTGLAEEQFYADFTQRIFGNSNWGSSTAGLGLNSTTAFTGLYMTPLALGSFNSAFLLMTPASLVGAPALGINTVYCLEQSAASTFSYYGTQSNMMLTLEYEG